MSGRRTRNKRLRRAAFIFLLIIFIILAVTIKYAFSDNDRYPVIALSKNKYYSGLGQQNSGDGKGYFTTFETAEGRVYREYKQNGKAPWANQPYWDGTMADSGCGITALSIILSGYGIDYTPEDLRVKYYPVMDYDYMQDELIESFGLDAGPFCYDPYITSEEGIIEHLKTGSPVLVCVWDGHGENRWTTESHYLVLLACDDNDMVYVSNPNGLENRSNSSGWYNINEVASYVAKAMYVY